MLVFPQAHPPDTEARPDGPKIQQQHQTVDLVSEFVLMIAFLPCFGFKSIPLHAFALPQAHSSSLCNWQGRLHSQKLEVTPKVLLPCRHTLHVFHNAALICGFLQNISLFPEMLFALRTQKFSNETVKIVQRKSGGNIYMRHDQSCKIPQFCSCNMPCG